MRSSRTRQFLTIGAAWLTTSLAIGSSGVLTHLRPPLPQLVLVALLVPLLIAFWRSESFRLWLAAVHIDWLVLLHVTRFVGFYFLSLYSRGELPYGFAVPEGWGDIGVATGATALVVLGRTSRTAPTGAYLTWNFVGLLDILFVVATAAMLGVVSPQSMGAMLRLPLSLLPTFLVPLIIFTHIVIAWRLIRRRE